MLIQLADKGHFWPFRSLTIVRYHPTVPTPYPSPRRPKVLILASPEQSYLLLQPSKGLGNGSTGETDSRWTRLRASRPSTSVSRLEARPSALLALGPLRRPFFFFGFLDLLQL